MLVELPQPEFVIKALVRVKHQGYIDHQSTGKSQNEDSMVFLIPMESSHRDYLFARHLPDCANEFLDAGQATHHTELACSIAHPVCGLARIALMRRDRRCESNYLFVMTKAVEEDLKNCDGAEVEVRVYSEDMDHLLDSQKKFDLVNKKSFDA
jgi:hypothetical protein